MSWASETARLRALMRRIVVASAAAGAGGGALCAAACDASKGTAERGSDAADEPVSPVADAEVDAAESAPGDDAADGALWPPGCTPPDPIEYDAGADAAGCEYRVLLPCGRPEFLDTIWPPTCTMSEYECSLICTGVAAPATACEVANGFGCDV